jgi:hypothetical protein
VTKQLKKEKGKIMAIPSKKKKTFLGSWWIKKERKRKCHAIDN